MKNYHIRPGTTEDTERWLILRKSLWRNSPDAQHRLEMEQVLSSSGGVFFAEDPEGRLIGFAEFSIRNDYVPGADTSPVPFLEGWLVDENHRVKGVGKELLAAIEDWSRQNGYKQLASDALIDNGSGIEIHKKLGFSEVERTVHLVKRLF
ncbi:MAG: GNAT family N-acetyltransferase [Dehalococcoidales bacterium]|nr:MAG: GNAT family N-acetyltransferase [Dehalococcoidales bacterium]